MRYRTIAALFALTAALFAGAATPEKPFPDTEAGRIAAAYLKILNTGDDREVLEFIAAHFGEAARKKRTDEERLQVFHDMKLRMGEVRAHSVLKSEAGRLSILAETERTGWVSFEFVFEDGLPDKLDSIVIEQAEPPM